MRREINPTPPTLILLFLEISKTPTTHTETQGTCPDQQDFCIKYNARRQNPKAHLETK